MKPEDFEQQLRSKAIRQVPESWRGQILAAAQRAHESSQVEAEMPRRTTYYSLKSHALACFWPSPQAWVGLAAVWIIIAIINIKTGGRVNGVSGTSAAETRELVTSWKEQERLLSEIIHFQESPVPVVETSRPAPRPRSEQKSNFRLV
jgi:hypothetical protein